MIIRTHLFLIDLIIWCVFFSSCVLGEELIFEDFLGTTNKEWEFISDKVMGGVSTGSLSFVNEKNYVFARLTGNVSIENNGGFIQFRRITDNFFKPNFIGIRLETRGNNQTYFVHIRTKDMIFPWQYYQAPFFANENWEFKELPFESFERSGVLIPKNIKPKRVTSIAIVAFGYMPKVSVDIKNIIFY